MSYGGITDLPCLRHYDAALRHYESITPLRGTQIRPICNTTNGRRKKWATIYTANVDQINAVVCKLYDTEVITFLEDGRVVIDNSYESTTTNGFVSGIIRGIHMSFVNHQVWMLTPAGRYRVGDKITIRRNEKDVWVPLDPVQHVVHHIDRREMKRVKAPVKAFMDHCLNIAKLMRDADISSPPMAFPPNQLMSIMTNPERVGWADAINQLLYGSSSVRWVRGTQGFNRVYRVNIRKLKEDMQRLLLNAHKHEVLVPELVPIGTYKRDRYGEYV
jgi:hypothetical protein